MRAAHERGDDVARYIVGQCKPIATVAVGFIVAGFVTSVFFYFGDIFLTFFLAWLLAFIISPIVSRIVDDGEFLEVFPLWADSIVIGFARLDGRSVGLVANQPKVGPHLLQLPRQRRAIVAPEPGERTFDLTAQQVRQPRELEVVLPGSYPYP